MENEQAQTLISLQEILSVFKSPNEAKRMREIKDAVIRLVTPEDELFNGDQVAIESEIERLIKEDKKAGDNSELKYKNGKYQKRKKVSPPLPGGLNSNYTGAAGECAVMSELLFNGYNVNRMMVDEGVDIVAVKENIYYYIQVKTTAIKPNGNISCQIDKSRHAQYIGNQMRYYVVARTKDHKGYDCNLFFKFDNSLIDQAIYNRCISVGEKINIKIRFNPKTGEPMLYDEKEMPIGFYLNNFKL